MIYPTENPPQEQQERPPETRDAYMAAMQQADDLVTRGLATDWESAFKKTLAAALLQIPGKQTINAKG